MTHLRTRAVHAGQHPDPTTGAIATPISQTTAFGYGTLERGAAIFAGEEPGYRYSRFANPTVAALEAKMADLEGAAAAVAFASGTAASSSVLLGLLNPGDELVFLGPLYGGTEGLLRNLGERWGITVVDATTRGLQDGLTPATRMVWVETLTNPTLRLHDLFRDALEHRLLRGCRHATVAHHKISPRPTCPRSHVESSPKQPPSPAPRPPRPSRRSARRTSARGLPRLSRGSWRC